MRSSVSYMLSHGSGEPTMSHPDYEQHAHHHGCLLVLIRGIGPSKPRSLQKIFERIQRVNNVRITDSSGQIRDVWIRYVRDHPVENNDWGDFQTHRRLLGLITVGKFDSQTELNELCRVHESLKVKYTNTLYDSRCILFGKSVRTTTLQQIDINSTSSQPSSLDSGGNFGAGGDCSQTKDSLPDDVGRSRSSSPLKSYRESNKENEIIDKKSDDQPNETDEPIKLEESYTTPTNFKSRAFFYPEFDVCESLESNIVDFINSLFWILESKRLEKSRIKVDKVQLLLAPFEKKDFIGLDLETRNNKKRCLGRVTKNLADLTLQVGLVAESLNLFHTASETLRAISDSLWLGAANEGLCAASAILMYPNVRYTMSFQRNASLPESSPVRQAYNRKDNVNRQMISKRTGLVINLDGEREVNDKDVGKNNSDSSSTSSSQSSIALSNSSSSGTLSTAIGNDFQYPANILRPEEITNRYRDAIINYSKYRHAGIIETEAALKAARICIEQNQNLDVAMFLQNVLYINLTLSEAERVQRFETLTELYQRIGYHRKAAFCQRLAAWRHVAQSNTNPDWSASYRLMLDSFPGHRLTLDPIDVLSNNAGWPCLQIDLLQQLVVAARRLGMSALATRHMTFLLQTMWKHLSPFDQKEMALQLQSLSAQCEGSPVPLVLESTGTVIPPANLTDLPYCQSIQVKNIPAHYRPCKISNEKVDSGPFIFTPIHFSSSIDRRAKKNDTKIEFNWIQNDLCEVTFRLFNPLPFDLKICDMRLLTTGIVFESVPQTIILPVSTATNVSLYGTPIEHGTLEIQGYSTHTLGVKSNCRMKHMSDRSFPPKYVVNVIPALPKIDVSTSLPQTATFSSLANAESVVTTASLCLYNGEQYECYVNIKNQSQILIEYMDGSIQSTLESGFQSKIFQWSIEDLQSKLPIEPGDSIDLKIIIFAEADFLGPINNTTSISSHHDGPHSLLGTMSVSMGQPSLPSRMSSPTPMAGRRTELTSSFRSTNSGHSSLATLSLGISGAGPGTNAITSRQLEAQFRLKYSGGDGLREGYCRECAILFSLEFLPSAHVTHWDVLPAEIPSQFYLVLDVVNLTAQEMSLNYTTNKNILIEAKESCRIPVPVERCPMERLLAENAQNEENKYSLCPGLFNNTEIDPTERACSAHVSDQVNLKWTLNGTETHGRTSLKGITLSPTMLGLITVAPLQWEIYVNSLLLAPQAEIVCSAGQSTIIGIGICNLSPSSLNNLTLTIQFYQDYQNGLCNYRLETRAVTSGPNYLTILKLDRNERALHECSVIFFTPGRYKADIQCRSMGTTVTNQPLDLYNLTVSGFNAGITNAESQSWSYIPALEITVVE